MTAATNWLRQTRRTYFGNAAAQRDFRVQLRGNRSMLLRDPDGNVVNIFKRAPRAG